MSRCNPVTPLYFWTLTHIRTEGRTDRQTISLLIATASWNLKFHIKFYLASDIWRALFDKKATSTSNIAPNLLRERYSANIANRRAIYVTFAEYCFPASIIRRELYWVWQCETKSINQRLRSWFIFSIFVPNIFHFILKSNWADRYFFKVPLNGKT